MARSALASALSKLFKYMGTRNVRVQARGLKKGMGITRQGQVKNLGGGKRILKKTGGGTTFLKSHAKVGMSRGQKAGSGALAVSAVGAGYMYKPSGPPTAGQKQFAPVNWKKDVAKWSKVRNIKLISKVRYVIYDREKPHGQSLAPRRLRRDTYPGYRKVLKGK